MFRAYSLCMLTPRQTLEKIAKEVNASLTLCVEKFNAMTKHAYERELADDASLNDYLSALALLKDDCCGEYVLHFIAAPDSRLIRRLVVKQSILKSVECDDAAATMKELSLVWSNAMVDAEKCVYSLPSSVIVW
jgi:hypothetical protein